MASGPLVGVRVIEFAGLGPGPYAGMFLSDLGAEVIEIAREGQSPPEAHRGDARGRKRICLNLKTPEAVETCLRLAEKAELLFEGNRPGVMERLGLGPEVMLAHQGPELRICHRELCRFVELLGTGKRLARRFLDGEGLWTSQVARNEDRPVVRVVVERCKVFGGRHGL